MYLKYRSHRLDTARVFRSYNHCTCTLPFSVYSVFWVATIKEFEKEWHMVSSVCRSHRQAGSQLFPLQKPLCKSGYWFQTAVLWPCLVALALGWKTASSARWQSCLGFGHWPRKHDLSFSCCWVWRQLPFGMWRRVVRQQIFGFS